MAYTTINKSSNFFDTLLWTGNAASSRAITGLNFQPDWSWAKNRDNSSRYHVVADSVRGSNGSGGMKLLYPNDTQGENTSATDNFKTLDSNGFTIGSDANVNSNSENIVAWNWKAVTTGSGNTTGSGTYKTYSYSVSTISGFSIIKYVGNGSGGHTIPHHLGAVPDSMIIKNLDSTTDWTVYHKDVASPNTRRLRLNSNDYYNTDSSYWNNTSPSSTVFTVGSSTSTNGNDTNYIAYCFTSITGYSKLGGYTGNGNADGTFIYTGFKPALIIIKKATSSGSQNWRIIDNKRLGYNDKNNPLYPSIANSEGTSETTVDIISNGFKLRGTGDAINSNGVGYIYYAFASAPLVGSNNVPCTAK